MRFFIVGRLTGLTQASLVDVLRRLDHSRTTSLRSADRVVLANSAAAGCITAEGHLQAPLDAHAERVISEKTFRAEVGLGDVLPIGPIKLEVASNVSGLHLDALRALQLADVVCTNDGVSFSDLALCRRIAGWLRRGFTLPQVIEAHRLSSNGDISLSDADIRVLPFGAMGLVKDNGLSRAGQLELLLDETLLDTASIFEAARLAEDAGELEASTALYEAALRFDAQDAFSAFNLGNVLDSRGLVAHAKIAYLRATKVDPAFSDAWSNLGMIAERQGRRAEAEQLYSRAIAMSPEHTTAMWNLARLLCDEERFAEALPYWKRISTLSRDDRTEALKWARICRTMIARPLQV